MICLYWGTFRFILFCLLLENREVLEKDFEELDKKIENGELHGDSEDTGESEVLSKNSSPSQPVQQSPEVKEASEIPELALLMKESDLSGPDKVDPKVPESRVECSYSEEEYESPTEVMQKNINELLGDVSDEDETYKPPNNMSESESSGNPKYLIIGTIIYLVIGTIIYLVMRTFPLDIIAIFIPRKCDTFHA